MKRLSYIEEARCLKVNTCGTKVTGRLLEDNDNRLQYNTARFVRKLIHGWYVPSYLTEHRCVIATKLPGKVFLVDRAGNTSMSISFNVKPSRFNMKSKFPDDMR